MITKLYEKKYGCKPPESPKQVAVGKAPGAPSAAPTGSGKKDDDISDDYDDDFDDLADVKLKSEQPSDKKEAAKKKIEDDDWDLDMKDDDWGSLDEFEPNKRNPIASSKDKAADDRAAAEKKRQNLFFGGQDDVADLDDLPEIGSNFPNKNEDKFNMVMSGSKEGGGLLASIGLKKDELQKDESLYESQEEDPHKKSNLFDNSKDRIGEQNKKADAHQSDEEDFDLGFGSSRKDKEAENKKAAKATKDDFPAPDNEAGALEAELAGMSENDDGPISDEQQQAIHEQFKLIYEQDPELRKALEKSDVASFSVAEKY